MEADGRRGGGILPKSLNCFWRSKEVSKPKRLSIINADTAKEWV